MEPERVGMNIMIDADLRAALKGQAAQERTSMSTLITRLVTEYLSRQKPKGKK